MSFNSLEESEEEVEVNLKNVSSEKQWTQDSSQSKEHSFDRVSILSGHAKRNYKESFKVQKVQ